MTNAKPDEPTATADGLSTILSERCEEPEEIHVDQPRRSNSNLSWVYAPDEPRRASKDNLGILDQLHQLQAKYEMESESEKKEEKSSRKRRSSLVQAAIVVADTSGSARDRIREVVFHPYFDGFILIAIIINSLFLAIVTPITPRDAPEAQIGAILDIIFTVIFVAEAALKMVALGLWVEGNEDLDIPQGYFRDGWNVLDFFLIVAGFLTSIPGTENLIALRALRVLRPLRTIRRVPGMQVIVNTLFSSFRQLLDVLVLLIFLFVIYGIIGVQLFNGSLHFRCYDNNLTIESQNLNLESLEFCNTNGYGYTCPQGFSCLERGPNPGEGLLSFDNIGSAFFTMFQIITLEGWSNIMYNYSDAVTPYAWIYFVSLVFLVSFFGINLVLAIIADTFAMFSAEHDNNNEPSTMSLWKLSPTKILKNLSPTRSAAVRRRSSFMGRITTPNRLSSMIGDFMDNHKRMRVLATQERLRLLAYKLCENVWFSRFILFLICLNTIFLSLEHHGMSKSLADTLETANLVLTIFFAVEMAVKLFGYGFRGYVEDSFNVFDAILVIVSFAELSFIGGGGGFSVLRLMRLLRVFKMIKSLESLRILMSTILGSLSGILNMTALMGIFVFVFAVLGIQLFGGQLGESEERWNFDNILWASVAVFQCITLDNWNGMVADVNQFIGGGVAVIYFVIVVSLGYFIIFNLFIAIMLQQFTEANVSEIGLESTRQMTLKDLEEQTMHLLEKQELAEQDVRTLIKRTLRHNAKQKQEKRNEKFQQIKEEQEDGRPADVKMEGKSFGLFSPDALIRRLCFQIVQHKVFEPIVLIVILTNCALLAYENPRMDQSPSVIAAFAAMDLFFAVFFTLEMLLKMMAFGVWKTSKSAYLSDNWNRLDAFVVAISLISLMFPTLTIFRAFRALRPLRLMVRSKKIRVVVSSLFHALPAIANVFIFWAFFNLVFGILAVNLFKGTFYQCSDESIFYETDCFGTFQDEMGVTQPRFWFNTRFNFDNILVSTETLVQVATLSDWATIMYRAIDATGVGTGPKKNTQSWAVLFFVSYIIVGSFFAFNLFVGVVIDNFQRLKSRLDGSAFLTSTQRRWVNAQQLLNEVSLRLRPIPPANRLGQVAFRIVEHGAFDMFIMFCIISNTGFMCAQHYNQSAEVTEFLSNANRVFVGIFTVEAVLKIMAYGFWLYWKDSWNRFDFVIVLLSFVNFVWDSGLGASVFRVGRIARVFRLVKKAQNLQKLFQTLIYSLPSLWNIGALVFVIFFIYGVLGVNLFGLIPRTEGGLTRHANFDDIGFALLTLFRVATGDDWEQIKNGSYLTGRWCPEGAADCGSPVAPFYYISFYIIGASVVLELFLAVILENFGAANKASEQQILLQKIISWKEIWEILDPLASGWIPIADFELLMGLAPPPFGFGVIHRREPFLKRISQLQIVAHKQSLNDIAIRDSAIECFLPQKKRDPRFKSLLHECYRERHNFNPDHQLHCLNFKHVLMSLARLVGGFDVDADADIAEEEDALPLELWFSEKYLDLRDDGDTSDIISRSSTIFCLTPTKEITDRNQRSSIFFTAPVPLEDVDIGNSFWRCCRRSRIQTSPEKLEASSEPITEETVSSDSTQYSDDFDQSPDEEQENKVQTTTIQLQSPVQTQESADGEGEGHVVQNIDVEP